MTVCTANGEISLIENVMYDNLFMRIYVSYLLQKHANIFS